MLWMFDSVVRPCGLLACLLALSGCDNSPPPVLFDAGHHDAGAHDGGARTDAGRDAATSDAGHRDAGRPDQDAGPPTCTIDPTHVWKIAHEDVASDRTVGLAAGGSAFGVVFTQAPAGGTTPEVHGLRLSSDGTLGTPQQITQPPGAKRPPTLAAVGTAWVASWVDNGSSTFEVRTRALASDLSVASGSTVHDITATATALEDNPVLIESSSGLLLAWVEDDMTALTRTARTRALDITGAPTADAQTASGDARTPGQLALGEIGSGPVLLWTEGSAGAGEVYVQLLRSSGATSGTATPISTEANADGTIDAVLHPSGGAVVFGALVGGVRSEVRFRPLDTAGAPTSDERVLATGTDASIAAFAGGYAISYRAAASGTTPPEVHLLLVDAVGDVVDDIVVSQAAEHGGRTTVRVSGDGQIAVAWADQAETGTNIQLAHIACGTGG